MELEQHHTNLDEMSTHVNESRTTVDVHVTVSHTEVEVTLTEEKPATTTDRKVRRFTDDDGTMRVASKMNNMGARISYLTKRLGTG